MKSHGRGDLPGWLDKYIKIIGRAPNRFDFAGFSLAMSRGAHCRNNWIGVRRVATVGSHPARKYTTFGGRWHLLSMAIQKR